MAARGGGGGAVIGLGTMYLYMYGRAPDRGRGLYHTVPILCLYNSVGRVDARTAVVSVEAGGGGGG